MELAVGLWAAAFSRLSSHRSRPRAPGCLAPVGGLPPSLPGAGFSTTNSAPERPGVCALGLRSERVSISTQRRKMDPLLGLNPGRTLISSSSSPDLSAPDRTGPPIFLWRPMASVLCVRSTIIGGEEAMPSERTKDAKQPFPSEEEEHYLCWGAEGLNCFTPCYYLVQTLIATLNTIF